MAVGYGIGESLYAPLGKGKAHCIAVAQDAAMHRLIRGDWAIRGRIRTGVAGRSPAGTAAVTPAWNPGWYLKRAIGHGR